MRIRGNTINLLFFSVFENYISAKKNEHLDSPLKFKNLITQLVPQYNSLVPKVFKAGIGNVANSQVLITDKICQDGVSKLHTL